MTSRRPFVAAAAMIAVFAAALASAVFAPSPARAAEDHAGHEHGAARPGWPREVVDLFANLPVQDGGRVKPLSTFADFELLQISGRRTYRTNEKASLTATEWLLDTVFLPSIAMEQKVFRIQTDEVLDAVGLPHEGKNRRDWYTYEELFPARDRIVQLASQYARIEPKDQSAVQGQLVHLAQNIARFERLADLVGFTTRPLRVADSPAAAAVFGADVRPRLADVLARAPEILRTPPNPEGPSGHGTGPQLDPALGAFLGDAAQARGLAMFPPSGTSTDESEWLTPGDLVEKIVLEGATLAPQVETLAALEDLAASRHDLAAFRTKAQTFRDRVVVLAEARGEYRKIPLEVTYYRWDFFTRAQIVFVLAFLGMAFSWMGARGKRWNTWLHRGSLTMTGIALALLTAGIVMRCIIRERPPVTTLYESILLVSAVAVLGSLAGEWINRQRIGAALAPFAGAAGLFLANKYEMREAVDTMPTLQAVLDTNFWLWTHVTTITIGYGAGLLAGLLGHVFIVGKVFGAKSAQPDFYKSLTRMTYGLTCFALLFSIVGTVLGGIWANESWGRFWGWDPKENGALMICLWQLIVLHARLGGYIRDLGLAMASVFGGVVIASSWWGVNLLGVGLHSYGFTSGILLTLLVFYGVEALFLGAGGAYAMFFQPKVAKVSKVADIATPKM